MAVVPPAEFSNWLVSISLDTQRQRQLELMIWTNYILHVEIWHRAHLLKTGTHKCARLTLFIIFVNVKHFHARPIVGRGLIQQWKSFDCNHVLHEYFTSYILTTNYLAYHYILYTMDSFKKHTVFSNTKLIIVFADIMELQMKLKLFVTTV